MEASGMAFRAASAALVAFVSAILSSASASTRDELPSRGELRKWGMEALERIRSDLYAPDSGLYADKWDAAKGRSGPAFMWGCGVMVSALNAAAALDRRHAPELERYVRALDVYWNPAGPTPGYDVLPCPKPVDRYYDDNVWVVLALVETSEVLRDRRYVGKAEAAMDYVLSGLDDRLGGGIYWRERDKASKNTCSNAPSALACYRLHEATREVRYRDRGDRILDWTTAKLRDPEDMLMWDKVSLGGKVDRTKWSYNTALVIRALLARARLERNLERAKALRAEAVAMAEAGLARWQDAGTGAFRDDGAFAHLFLEALLELDERLGNARFRPKVLRALAYLTAARPR
jgi:hypothetical protein